MDALSGTFHPAAAITGGMRHEGADADVDLMRQTAAGDRDAFARLYRKHHATVFRFARLMTGSTEAAEDVVQEVFLGLMRGAARYDPARAQLTTYLYGVARRQIRRRWLRDRLFVSLDDTASEIGPAPSPTAADALSRERDVHDVRRAVLALPARYREVIVLCDLQDVSYADAAAVLSCAIGTVRSRLHRGRHLLMEKLQRSRACAAAPPRPTLRCEA
jgi:RNA polymerase sigma-70 factor (ECF subfamily)